MTPKLSLQCIKKLKSMDFQITAGGPRNGSLPSVGVAII